MTKAKFKFYVQAEYAEILGRSENQQNLCKPDISWLKNITELHNLLVNQSDDPVVYDFIQNAFVQHMAEKRCLLQGLLETYMRADILGAHKTITADMLKNFSTVADIMTEYYR